MFFPTTLLPHLPPKWWISRVLWTTQPWIEHELIEAIPGYKERGVVCQKTKLRLRKQSDQICKQRSGAPCMSTRPSAHTDSPAQPSSHVASGLPREAINGMNRSEMSFLTLGNSCLQAYITHKVMLLKAVFINRTCKPSVPWNVLPWSITRSILLSTPNTPIFTRSISWSWGLQGPFPNAGIPKAFSALMHSRGVSTMDGEPAPLTLQ